MEIILGDRPATNVEGDADVEVLPGEAGADDDEVVAVGIRNVIELSLSILFELFLRISVSRDGRTRHSDLK